MHQRLLKQLVELSFRKGELNRQEVSKIADALNRQQLKAYIGGLKKRIKKETIYVDLAAAPSQKLTEKVTMLYPNKQLAYRVAPELLMGMRITDGDNVFGLNLHDRLETLRQYIGE